MTFQSHVSRQLHARPEKGVGESVRKRESVCERLEIDGGRVGEEEMREGGI